MRIARLCGRWCALAAALSLALLANAAAGDTPQADAERYWDTVRFLASPELEGRGAGTQGLERTAHYLEEQFRSIGLNPAGENGGFRQAFRVTTGATLREHNRLAAQTGDGEQTYKISEDFAPMSFSSVGDASGEVVFAGYGVSADEFNYDDFTHFDVRDKIVVVLRYEPLHFSPPEGQEPRRYTPHSRLVTKAINARQRGAKAVILVNGELPPGEEDTLLRFGSVAGPEDVGILVVQAKNAVVDAWLAAAGKSLAELQQAMDRDKQPQSLALPETLTVSIQVDIERTHAQVANVLGYLPGASEEYVVIGAHYDHLGLGNESSLAPSLVGTVHPGADDNASGTAGLLELARLLAAGGELLPRGVLFAAFAAEEIGLLGSAYWTNHPTMPIDNTLAMINMDMIGRIREPKLYVGGVKTGSTFEAVLAEVAAGYDFTLESSPGGYSASDNTSFIAKQIPALFFFSGLHGDYHKPSDTWDKINAEGAAKLLNLIADVTEKLAADERPQFVKVESDMRSMGGGGRGYGPYFGSIPDFGEVETGVRFADIRPGSPADKAGLKAGDILIQFGEMPIKNLYDFTFALQRSKVGDVVEVKCLRDGQVITASVTLEQRK